MSHPETPHSAFIPVQEVRHRSPEIPLVEGIVGIELLTALDTAVATDYRLTDAERPPAAERIRTLVEACKLNEPLLLLNWPMEGGHDLAATGYVSSEVGLNDDLQLYLEIWADAQPGRDTPADNWARKTIHYDLGCLIDDAANGRTRLVVGEPAVRTWFARRSLALANVAEPTDRQIRSDMSLLREMLSARIPFDYLNLSESQIALAAAHCETVLLDPSDFTAYSRSMFDVYEALNNATTDQQKAMLYNNLVIRLATEAPVTHQAGINTSMLSLVHKIGGRMPMVQGATPDLDLGSRARAAILMSAMYRAASQRPELAEAEIPAFEPAQLMYGPWPENHMPHGFNGERLPVRLVREDIAYLNYLHSTGASVEVLHRTGLRVNGLTHNIHRFMLRGAERQDIPQALQALEYLYGVRTPQQRRKFYAKEFLYTIARAAPVGEHEDYYLRDYVTFVEALVSHLPEEFFAYNNPPLTGQALTAGLLADIYELRASGLVSSDLCRFGRDEENDLRHSEPWALHNAQDAGGENPS